MKLELVIDLDPCAGRHACGATGPLTGERPYERDPEGGRTTTARGWVNKLIRR